MPPIGRSGPFSSSGNGPLGGGSDLFGNESGLPYKNTFWILQLAFMTMY
jgi:hypothetical protein